MIQMNAPDIDNAQEIDLIELAKRLWGERKFFFLNVAELQLLSVLS